MKYPTVFHLIADLTEKHKISCVIIGGFAVNYYKVGRQTVDVDMLITREDFEKVTIILHKAGYQKNYIQETFAKFTDKKTNFMDVDFMFVNKETLERIIAAGKKMNIAGQKVMVPSLNNLIALKLHSLKYNYKIREIKDLPDIINLIRVNDFPYRGKEFKELCLKYGTAEIYERILKAL
ncbi:MAG: nucleotidyltransferase [Elusimicrobia bacterium]|nr:nucleotidyltransferase [Elusimicrobiota bacterium]